MMQWQSFLSVAENTENNRLYLAVGQEFKHHDDLQRDRWLHWDCVRAEPQLLFGVTQLYIYRLLEMHALFARTGKTGSVKHTQNDWIIPSEKSTLVSDDNYLDNKMVYEQSIINTKLISFLGTVFIRIIFRFNEDLLNHLMHNSYYIPICFNIKNVCKLRTECTYVYNMTFWTNNGNFPIQL